MCGCFFFGCLGIPIVIGTFCLFGPTAGVISLFCLLVFSANGRRE